LWNSWRRTEQTKQSPICGKTCNALHLSTAVKLANCSISSSLSHRSIGARRTITLSFTKIGTVRLWEHRSKSWPTSSSMHISTKPKSFWWIPLRSATK
jgi:hypothetical protein